MIGDKAAARYSVRVIMVHAGDARSRDLLTQAANIIAGTVIDLIGDIGRRVLDNLLPDRRLRVGPRVVKRAISKYQARDPDINRRSYKATLSIAIVTADLDALRRTLTTWPWPQRPTTHQMTNSGSGLITRSDKYESHS